MNLSEEELKARFRPHINTAPVASEAPAAEATVIPVLSSSKPQLRLVGKPDVCAELRASSMTRLHCLTEFQNLWRTEPAAQHRTLTWSQLVDIVAPLPGIPSAAKDGIPLFIAGSMREAPWVGETKAKKDDDRRRDPSVPTQGVQRSSAHVAALDAAIGDVDDKPGACASVEDVANRLERIGVAYVSYSSWSGVTKGNGSGRIVAPVDRSILPTEWPDFFRAWQEICGNQLDEAGRGCAQAYIRFGVPVNATPEEVGKWRRESDGHVLSVDKMLERGRQLNTRKAPKARERSSLPSDASEYWKIKLALDVLAADDYNDWISAGAALRRELGEASFSLWQTWSSKSLKYDGATIRQKWETLSPEHNSQARLGTIHFKATEAAKAFVESKLLDQSARAEVGVALAYLLRCHPSDGFHSYLRENGRVPPDMEVEAHRVLAWHDLSARVFPRKPVVYMPGKVQPAMRALAAAIATVGRVFLRDGQLVRLCRAGELLSETAPRWRQGLAASAPVLIQMQGPEDVVVEADPHVAVVRIDNRTVRPTWALCDSVVVPRYQSRDIPADLARKVLQYGSELGFRNLEGIVEHPVLRRDGSVIDRDGYDQESGWLYAPNTSYPDLPSPTRENALSALDRLKELYAEFPFSDPGGSSDCRFKTASFAAAVAALLTRAQPVALDCRKPLFALNGPAAGSGKTTLDAIPALVFSGREPVTHVLARDPAESKKEILTLLIEGHLDITLDNVNGLLDSAELSSLTTAEEFSGRILGTNRSARVKPRANWHVNGNGLALKGDLRSRAVWHELDPRMARPDERAFRMNLREYISNNRAALVIDVLTILLAYRASVQAGEVPADVLLVAPRCRFALWEELVRKPILWLGLPDPLGNREAALATDMDDEHTDNFLAAIEAAQALRPLAVASSIADAASGVLRNHSLDAARRLKEVSRTSNMAPVEILAAIRECVAESSLPADAHERLKIAMRRAQELAESRGLGSKFSTRQIVSLANGPDCPTLKEALADLGIDVQDAKAHKSLGYALRRIANVVIEGRRIASAGRSSGTSATGGARLWMIDRVQ